MKLVKRANAAITTTALADGRGLLFSAATGESQTLLFADVDKQNLANATAWGLARKVVNAAALPCDEVTGKPPTTAAKWALVTEMIDRMKQPGGWLNGRGERGEPDGDLLALAIYRLGAGRHTVESVSKTLWSMTKEQRTTLRTQNATVVATIGALKAERAARAGNASANDLLALFASKETDEGDEGDEGDEDETDEDEADNK